MLEVMSPYKETSLRGIFHSFGGSLEEANDLLSYKNFMLGINGIVTFKKSILPDTLKQIQLPLERIVLETDSPYLAPVPHRGERNESAYILSIANKLADIFDTSIDDIARHTTRNALKVFQNAD
jgi:TatD DNase family protein